MSKPKTPAGNGNKRKPPVAKAPETKAPETKAAETPAAQEEPPEVEQEETKAPETQAEETKAPEDTTKPPIPEKDVKSKDKKECPRITRAREVFKSHTCDKVYFTVDGTCFVEPQYAHMHAANLKSDVVTIVTRKEAE